MNPGLLQTQLQVPYRRESWFAAGGLLSQLVPGRLERFAQPVVLPLTAKAQTDVATGFRQLGRAVIPAGAHGPERIIALHEIDVAAGIDLLRNRVALRQLIVRGIDEVNAHAVLAFFVQPGVPAYRLTYAARESVLDPTTFAVERKETAARRFTYVLGPGSPHRTAALRLAELSENRGQKALTNVTAAFAVESLSKEFFDRYREHYRAFCDHLLGTDAPKRIFGLKLTGFGEDEKARDRALKPVRDFIKKLLGRLVFLHFLQKKGWLGCPADRTDWTGGDADFIASLFKTAPHPDRFHSERLVPLFFGTLNRPGRPHDLFPVTGTRVPYLNGGLFERDFARVGEIDFPAPLFAALLDFFGQYHFTIDENDPEDHEIGIDPEMLGHIFENLLEDNKDKGAYYTPKAVVHYMARQSLVHALAARFPADAAAKDEIAAFIRDKDPVDPKSKTWIARHATALAGHLDDLRICDPAIGSGAFPIGLLNEIYWAKLALNPSLPRAEAKRGIIQKSIHGVDLDAGAVEIARLRFWLALIVDEPAPVPLPNLDYQIMQGNSLLESFEGEPLDDLDAPTRYGIRRLGSDQNEFDLGTAPTEIVEVATPPQQALAELRRAYFACHDPEEKSHLRGLIDAAVLRAIDDRLARRRDELETSLTQEAAFVRGRKRTPAEEKKRAAMKEELAALGEKSMRLHALLADPRAERPFFLWHLWFRHILAAPPDGRGGFDIVIANPPYVRPHNLTSEFKEALWAKFATFEKKADLYVCFFEESIRLLAQSGQFSFIVSNGFLRLDSFEKLRQFLLHETKLQRIVDFSEDVFDSATVKTCLIFLQRGTTENETEVELTLTDSVDKLANLEFQKVRQHEFNTRYKSIIDFASNPKADALKERMRRTAVQLGEAFDLNFGLKTGDDEKFLGHVASTPQHRRLIRGEDTGAYFIHFKGEYVWYVPDKMRKHRQTARPGEAARFEQPKILVRDTGSGLRATIDLENYYAKDVLIVSHRSRSDALLKKLTALLNSRLMRYYYETSFPTLHVQRDELASLPVHERLVSDPSCCAELPALVDRILAAKRAGDSAAVEKLETEIDAHVYRLYGLTKDEIALIENRPAS